MLCKSLRTHRPNSLARNCCGSVCRRHPHPPPLHPRPSSFCVHANRFPPIRNTGKMFCTLFGEITIQNEINTTSTPKEQTRIAKLAHKTIQRSQSLDEEHQRKAARSMLESENFVRQHSESVIRLPGGRERRRSSFMREALGTAKWGKYKGPVFSQRQHRSTKQIKTKPLRRSLGKSLGRGLRGLTGKGSRNVESPKQSGEGDPNISAPTSVPMVRSRGGAAPPGSFLSIGVPRAQVGSGSPGTSPNASPRGGRGKKKWGLAKTKLALATSKRTSLKAHDIVL